MNDFAGAEIIPFPQRNTSGDLAQSTARLAEALSNLSTALSEQNAALQRWRSALCGLAERMQDVGSRVN